MTNGEGDGAVDGFPPLQRPLRSGRCRVCGEHGSTANIGLRAPAAPLLFGDA
jgi:hypothetical protein